MLIDAVAPPLGFRQYHAVDLAHGMRTARAIQPLVDAVSAKADARPAIDRPQARSPRNWTRFRSAAGVVLAVALIAIAVWLLLPRASSAANTIAVFPAEGSNQQSRELAQSIAMDLSRNRVGPSSTLLVVDDSKSAEYRIEVRSSRAGASLVGDLSLIERAKSRILWSDSIKAPGERTVDLRQQAVSSLVHVLACLAETQQGRAKIGDEGLALYLRGCGMLSDVNEFEPSEELLGVFRQLTVKEPGFALGWANLALLEVWTWPNVAPKDRSALVRTTREHINRAKQIDPDLPVVFAADASLPEHWQRPAKGLAILERLNQRHAGRIFSGAHAADLFGPAIHGRGASAGPPRLLERERRLARHVRRPQAPVRLPQGSVENMAD